MITSTWMMADMASPPSFRTSIWPTALDSLGSSATRTILAAERLPEAATAFAGVSSRMKPSPTAASSMDRSLMNSSATVITLVVGSSKVALKFRERLSEKSPSAVARPSGSSDPMITYSCPPTMSFGIVKSAERFTKPGEMDSISVSPRAIAEVSSSAKSRASSLVGTREKFIMTSCASTPEEPTEYSMVIGSPFR